ncbi:MAG: S24/S26 family peptidase [Clostridia bacterium]|nr:S24/S26 family peptidase [Clostridia bacterium]
MSLPLNINEILPLVEEQVKVGGYFYLIPKGVSMLPTIKGDADTVTLEAPDSLKSGDIVLYKRENGQVVLHRIVKIIGDELTLCGDAQMDFELGIKADDVVARVREIKKGERIIERGSFAFFGLYLLSRISRAAKISRLKIKNAIKRI